MSEVDDLILKWEGTQSGDRTLRLLKESTLKVLKAQQARVQELEAELKKHSSERPDTHIYGCSRDGDIKTEPCAECDKAQREFAQFEEDHLGVERDGDLGPDIYACGCVRYHGDYTKRCPQHSTEALR